METNLFDKEEIYPDCTVQVLTNTVTGEQSVGWWVKKRKTKPLEWYVWVGNFNKKQIERYNVFNHFRFYEDLQKHYRKIKDRDQFLEAVRKDLMYYYWSKAEWEVVIRRWIQKDEGEIKIDVYEQVMMNWDRFSEYLWENRKELRWRNRRRST